MLVIGLDKLASYILGNLQGLGKRSPLGYQAGSSLLVAKNPPSGRPSM